MADSKILLKPKKAVWAVWLLFVSLGLEMVNLFLSWDFVVSDWISTYAEFPTLQSSGFLLFLYMGIYALYIWLILKISAGCNWARITYFVTVILGVFCSFFQLEILFAGSFVDHIRVLLPYVIETLALYALFTNPASAWFKALKIFN